MGEARPLERYWLATLLIAVIALAMAGFTSYNSFLINPGRISSLNEKLKSYNTDIKSLKEKVEENTRNLVKLNKTIGINFKNYVDRAIEGNYSSLRNYLSSSIIGNVTKLGRDVVRNCSTLNVKIREYVDSSVIGNFSSMRSYVNEVVNGNRSYLTHMIGMVNSTLKNDVTRLHEGLINYIDGRISKLNATIKARLSKLEQALRSVSLIAGEGANLSKLLSPLVTSINDTAVRNALGNLTELVSKLFGRIANVTKAALTYEGTEAEVYELMNTYMRLTEASVKLRTLIRYHPEITDLKEVLGLVEEARWDLLGLGG